MGIGKLELFLDCMPERSTAMKWILLTVVILIAGWMAAVYFFNRSGNETVSLVTTDSLQAKQVSPISPKFDSVKAGADSVDTIQKNHLPLPKGSIDTKGVTPAEVVAFAKTQMGVPYLYGSTDPAESFDCSGFITFVFKHFNIAVPRSSSDFTYVGKEVSAVQAKAGD